MSSADGKWKLFHCFKCFSSQGRAYIMLTIPVRVGAVVVSENKNLVSSFRHIGMSESLALFSNTLDSSAGETSSKLLFFEKNYVKSL